MPWAVATAPAITAAVTPPANIAGAIPLASPAPRASATPKATATPAPPTLTPDERAEAEALLTVAALRPEDIPEGFPLEDEGFTTNEEAAQALRIGIEMFGSGDDAGLDAVGMGRMLEYHADYGPEGPADALSFGVSLELFQDSDGAHAYLAAVQEQVSDPESLTSFGKVLQSFGVESSDMSVSPLSWSEMGDQRVALEMKVTMRLPDSDTADLVEQVVVVRRGRLLGSVGVLTVNASPNKDLLEDLARKLDQRMKDALE
jgi:hypothetical protein